MHNAMHPPIGITPYAMDASPTAMPIEGRGGRGGQPEDPRPRRRKVCEQCARQRIKCQFEDSSATCTQCLRQEVKCVFPESQFEQPGTLQSDTDQYVKSLKDRLRRVESLLQATGILQENDITFKALSDDEGEASIDDLLDADRRPDSSGGSSNRSSDSYTSSEQRAPAPYEGGIEVAPIFKSHESDETRYFGRSCGLSILSRTGIEWIKSKTGETNFLNIISPASTRDDPWNSWRPDVFHDLFASQVYKPLPSRSEVFSLIKDFFRTANRLFPMYHESSFMRMVEWQYTQQTCDDAARWASINMVICLAYEYRFSNNMKPEKDREKARLYFKNAVSVFTELSIRRTDLLSVQSLLSMGFYLRGNSGTQSALPFITAAMRSCQRMGLHRDIPRPDLTPAQQEQRRRVFWVAFTIDQSSCLRAGNAPSQHPDDFDVPLPTELEDDHDPEIFSNITFFRQLCRMSVIKSRIYCRLYSAKALLKDPKEVYKIVQELHAELEDWKKDYPFDEIPRLQVNETDFLFGFASLGLHFIYYNALIMIHRIPLLLNYYILTRDESEEVKVISAAQASRSATICVVAARGTVKLINNMPWGDIAWVWSLLYYVFLAAATLFSHILRDTRNPENHDDIRSLGMASSFFSTLTPGDGTANYAGFMTQMSSTLERIARMAVERDEKRTRSPDENDEERMLPSAKKQASRSSHPKHRRKGTPRQSTLPSHTTSNSHHNRPSAASHAPIRSHTLPTSHIRASGIPENLADLPPVNSSGYVVPLGLNENDDFTSNLTTQQPTIPTSKVFTSGLGLSLDGTVPQEFQSSPTTLPWDQLPRTNPSNANSPFSNTQSPFSQESNNGLQTVPMIPESWQVPLTADWQFGDNPWAALFPNVAASAYGEEMSMPILSAESFLQGPTIPEEEVVPGPGNLAFGSDTMAYTSAPPNQGQAGAQDGQYDPGYLPNGYLGLGLF